MTSLLVTCAPGFTIGDERQVEVVCGEDGEWMMHNKTVTSSLGCHRESLHWFIHVPVCLQLKPRFIAAVSCPQPAIVLSAVLSSSKRSSFVFQDVISFKCRHGYCFEPGITQKNVTCTAAGEWSGDVGDCRSEFLVRNTCVFIAKLLSLIIFSLFSVISCPLLSLNPAVVLNSSDHVFDSTVHVTCAEGYTFAYGDLEEFNVTCLHTGEWSVNIPECEGQMFVIFNVLRC